MPANSVSMLVMPEVKASLVVFKEERTDFLDSKEEEEPPEENDYLPMWIPPASVRLIGTNQITGQGWNSGNPEEL